MGLIASVMCTCFADGIAANPPFAVHVKLDQAGFLSLDLPYENNQDKHEEFLQWLNAACKHPGMDFASEFISNWSGYRSFLQMLETIGSTGFPTLSNELPEGPGGLTYAVAAAKMIEELNTLSELTTLGWTTMLVDSETGQELHEYIAAYDGVFGFGPDGVHMGVDENGFFIWSRHGDGFREPFRSMKFQQNLLNKGLRKLLRSTAAEFVDFESGKTFRSRQGLFNILPWPDGRKQNDEGKFHVGYPTRMHVGKRERKVSEFDHIVGPLRRLCQAAVETGNPIRWH
jgi:hypothetical protein